MKWHDLDRTKYFVLSFGAAFLVLLMLALCMASLVNKPLPEENIVDKTPADAYYSPQEQDSLNVLIVASDEAGVPYSFFLTRLDVLRGEIPVAAFTPQTAVHYAGAPSTLAEVYAKNGAKAVKQALSEALGVDVQRYLAFKGDALAKALDTIGNVEYDLKTPLEYKTATGVTNLSAGRQLLDGTRFYDILRFALAAAPASEQNATASAELLAHYINSRLSAVLEPNADKIFSEVINLADSDISFEDYDSRKEALVFLAKLSGRHARSVLVRGSWNKATGVMELSASAGEVLSKMYG